MTDSPFRGVIPPVVIPLTEKRQLDLEALERSINRMIDAGVDGLFFLGSSGEVAFLTDAQRYHVLQEAIAMVHGRVPVLTGIIDMETMRVVDQAKRATGYGVDALVATAPFYALGGSASEPSAALNAAADPMRLLMLIPVVLLIYIAIKMRDALHAVTMATVAGLIIGLLTGVIEPSQIVRVENGSISGILTGGIANVSGIMLMCLALFGFTGVIEHAGLADATAKFLTNENQSPRRAEVTLAVATVFISTCLAAVTSVAVALAGQLADRLLRRSIDPYRRAYLLAGFANSIPVILPFSAFSLITLSAASALGDPALTPFSLMTATFYPIALFVVFSVSIATGIGRPKISGEPQSSDKA